MFKWSPLHHKKLKRQRGVFKEVEVDRGVSLKRGHTTTGSFVVYVYYNKMSMVNNQPKGKQESKSGALGFMISVKLNGVILAD